MKTLSSDLKRIEKKIRDNGEFSLNPHEFYKSLLIPIVSSNMDDDSDMINMVITLDQIKDLVLNELRAYLFDQFNKRMK